MRAKDKFLEKINLLILILSLCFSQNLNAEKIYEAFHPNAKITGYSSQTGNLLEMSVDDFANRVASLQPSMKEQGAAILLEILSIEIAGSTAAVRVRDAYRSLIFLDTLSFLKIDGEWKIYNKLYHVES